MEDDFVSSLFFAVAQDRSDAVRLAIKEVQEGRIEASSLNVLRKRTIGESNAKSDSDGILMTPLHLAIRRKNKDIIRAFINANADLNVKDGLALKPVELASKEGMEDVFSVELFTAVAQGDSNKIKYLVQGSVDVNSIDNELTCNTPLHWAASFGVETSLNTLISLEADMNQQNKEGATPLHDAAKSGNVSIIKLLVENGAARDILGTGGQFVNKTPLQLVRTDLKNYEEIEKLLDSAKTMTEIDSSRTSSSGLRSARRMQAKFWAQKSSHDQHSDIDDEEDVAHASKKPRHRGSAISINGAGDGKEIISSSSSSSEVISETPPPVVVAESKETDNPSQSVLSATSSTSFANLPSVSLSVIPTAMPTTPKLAPTMISAKDVSVGVQYKARSTKPSTEISPLSSTKEIISSTVPTEGVVPNVEPCSYPTPLHSPRASFPGSPNASSMVALATPSTTNEIPNEIPIEVKNGVSLETNKGPSLFERFDRVVQLAADSLMWEQNKEKIEDLLKAKDEEMRRKKLAGAHSGKINGYVTDKQPSDVTIVQQGVGELSLEERGNGDITQQRQEQQEQQKQEQEEQKPLFVKGVYGQSLSVNEDTLFIESSTTQQPSSSENESEEMKLPFGFIPNTGAFIQTENLNVQSFHGSNMSHNDDEQTQQGQNQSLHRRSFVHNFASTVETDPRLKLLWPHPQRLVQFEGLHLILPKTVVVYFPSFVPFAAREVIDHIWDYFSTGMRQLGFIATRTFGTKKHAQIAVSLNTHLHMQEQSYRITSSAKRIDIIGGDVDGLRYGFATTLQVVRLCALKHLDDISTMDEQEDSTIGIPPLRIIDFPHIRNRGFMLDVSRDKVPTMETLYQLVDWMADLKMNQLQLYMEHTFAYSDHKVVWEGADPYTADDIQTLDTYCFSRGIALVPNQNTCGHFHRFLRHDKYKHLAECPAGIDFGPRISGPRDCPFSLCPTDPQSVQLVSSLFDELFPNFRSSTLAHVGLDETVDLGLGRSKEACEERGNGDVYLQYLLSIHDLCEERGRTMMFWADMLQDYGSDIKYKLPHDAIAMEWGYEENHPFNERCNHMKDIGVPFYVCPGTSSWNSITGRTKNAMGNIASACKAAYKHNGLGVLLTDWGDYGHMQPLCVSFPSLVASGGFSWNTNDNAMVNFENENQPSLLSWTDHVLGPLVDVHIFHNHDVRLGQVLIDLGNVYLHTESEPLFNGAILFFFLIFSGPDTEMWRELSPSGLQECLHFTHIHDTRLSDIEASQTKGDNAQIDMAISELKLMSQFSLFAAELALLQAKNRTAIGGLLDKHRTDLANRFLALLAHYPEVWVLRNREGGMRESMKRLEHVLDCLLRKK
eukprot:m.129405 g.129405  ORF g.129405 m.129405 type:complete len:1346 (+) comp9460_c0_seq10:42-4079(+)